MRRATGMASARRRTRRPRSSTSSTRRSIPAIADPAMKARFGRPSAARPIPVSARRVRQADRGGNREMGQGGPRAGIKPSAATPAGSSSSIEDHLSRFGSLSLGFQESLSLVDLRREQRRDCIGQHWGLRCLEGGDGLKLRQTGVSTLAYIQASSTGATARLLRLTVLFDRRDSGQEFFATGWPIAVRLRPETTILRVPSVSVTFITLAVTPTE